MIYSFEINESLPYDLGSIRIRDPDLISKDLLHNIEIYGYTKLWINKQTWRMRILVSPEHFIKKVQSGIKDDYMQKILRIVKLNIIENGIS
jgi:hypothetical protein